jgi:hypothetical protein
LTTGKLSKLTVTLQFNSCAERIEVKSKKNVSIDFMAFSENFVDLIYEIRYTHSMNLNF